MLGLPTRSAPADIDERSYQLGEPLISALNVAGAKARAIDGDADDVVLGADTLVVAEGQVLGKPQTPDEARTMLHGLGGQSHQVLTGVALRTSSTSWGAVVSTEVVMRAYGADEVEQYMARGEPFDKAGGYAVQDQEFRPVERLNGCYLNVVGLPLCAVAAGLIALGAEVEPAGRPPCAYCKRGQPLVAIRSLS